MMLLTKESICEESLPAVSLLAATYNASQQMQYALELPTIDYINGDGLGVLSPMSIPPVEYTHQCVIFCLKRTGFNFTRHIGTTSQITEQNSG